MQNSSCVFPPSTPILFFISLGLSPLQFIAGGAPMEGQAASPVSPRDTSYDKEIERARRYLRALISSQNCAPMMLRLAFHDAGTYDALTKTGGPNGSIRNQQELQHSANRGLEKAVALCETVKRKYPSITYADLYQLAGVVAVEVTGGPTIPFVSGRKDSKVSPEAGRLPDANQGADSLRSVFNRMGFVDREIVALSGAHTLGGAHKHVSGFDGQWTEEPWRFDNSYFKELLKSNKRPKRPGDSQQQPPSAKERPLLFIFPSDHALLTDPKFRSYVLLFAQDEEAFFKYYAAAHKKLSELGLDQPTWASKLVKAMKNRSTMTNAAAGVLVVATALLGIAFFYGQQGGKKRTSSGTMFQNN